MTRFEIQELASQNQDGVTFRALDKSTNQIVSLRRFFPFGQGEDDEEGGEGLDPQEGKAFSSACQKLSRIDHPSLRKTIFGDTDPVDGMPFLVTEWIEGESLADVLGNNTMDPSMIIGLVRQALDVCVILSKTLENEAVWIDTKLEAIIVSNPTENPSFSFRICPFKWLGTQSHEKDLTGIVTLVEALMGWKSKLVSDQAGLGLGGWLKLLRQNPQTKLSDALQSLPDPSTRITSEPTTDNASNQPVQQPYILTSANPPLLSKKSIIIMAISACLTGALIFLLYQQKSKNVVTIPPSEDDKNTIVEQPLETPEILPKAETTPPITEITPENPEIAKPKTDTTSAKTKLWSPIEISPAAWYDAADTSTIIVSSGAVSQWNDKSGNDRNVAQASSGQQPTFAAQTVSFDGTDDILFRAGAFMYDNGSADIYVVGALDGTVADSRLLGESNSSSDSPLYLPFQNRAATDITMLGAFIRDDSKTDRFSNSTNSLSATGAFSISTRKLYQVGDTGSSLAGRVNGGNAATVNYTRRSTRLTSFGIGGICPRPSYTTGSAWMRADVNEIIIVPSMLDEANRQKIEGYLAHKWKLVSELPGDHPYKLSAPESSSIKSETLVSLPKTDTTKEEIKATPPKTRLWTPDDISTAAWYDASTATIKDGTVSIANAGSNGGTINGPASLVANGIGNLQTVQFNGTNQYLTGNYTNTGPTLTVFFVGKSLNTNQTKYAGMMSIWANEQINDWDNTSSAVLFSQNNNIENSIYGYRNANLSSATAPLTTGFVATTVFDGSNNTLYLNGTPSAAAPSSNSFNTNNLILGGRWYNGAISAPYWNGNFGEVMIFNENLNMSDRQKIEGYLAHKWSLTETLPADHPYKLLPPDASVSKTVPPNKTPIPETNKKESEAKPALWSPTDIAPIAWYDAADTSTITAKGGKISQWNDKSGGANHLKMSQAPNQPAYKNSTVVFAASDRLESDPTKLSAFVGPTPNKCAVFAVMKYNSGTVLMQIESAVSNRLSLEGNSRFDFPNDTAGKLDGWPQTISNNRFSIVAATADGTTQAAYVNGTLAASKSNSLSITDASGVKLGLGGQSGGGEPSAIEVQELIFLDAVSDQDRKKLEGYLAHKWKLTGNLPADHPYKSAPPTNATLGEMTTHKAKTVVTKIFSATPLAYTADVSNSDLLTGLTPVTTGWNTTNNASTLELTDGIHGLGFKEVAGDMIQGAFTTVGATAIYNLGTGANGLGFDITSMQSIADWPNHGFGNQAWTVAVKLVGGSDFVDFATVDYQPLGASDGGTTKVTLTDSSGVIAKGAEFIKITANSVSRDTKNKAFVWRELDVFGAPSSATPVVIDVLTPQNTEYIKTLKDGEPVNLQGIVKSAKFSSTEKSIYISFSDPDVETDIRVVIHGNDYEGGPFTEAAFAALIGKDLVFTGTVYTEKFNARPPFVKITEKAQIKVATADLLKKISSTAKTPNSTTATPETETASSIPLFSPDDVEAIAKIKKQDPAAVKGIVRSVKIPKPGSSLYIIFSDPYDGKQIRAVAYPKSLDGKSYIGKDSEFKKIEKDLQRLVGKNVLIEGKVTTHVGKVKPHFIYITSLDQIKEVK